MKTLNKIIFLLLIMSASCKAQNTINITDFRGHGEQGDYFKDIDFILNPFVGTFIYTSGSRMIKIEFRKMEMSDSTVYLEDIITGEYQVIDNNIQKINTLPNFLNNYTNGNAHSIRGNHVATQIRGCDECVPGEKAVRLGISEISTKNGGFMIVRRMIVNGQQAIKVSLVWELSYERTGYLPPSFPSGDYVLIKQP